LLPREEEYSEEDSLAAEDPNHKRQSQPKKDNEADFFGFGKSLTVKGKYTYTRDPAMVGRE